MRTVGSRHPFRAPVLSLLPDSGHWAYKSSVVGGGLYQANWTFDTEIAAHTSPVSCLEIRTGGVWYHPVSTQKFAAQVVYALYPVELSIPLYWRVRDKPTNIGFLGGKELWWPQGGPFD